MQSHPFAGVWASVEMDGTRDGRRHFRVDSSSTADGRNGNKYRKGKGETLVVVIVIVAVHTPPLFFSAR